MMFRLASILFVGVLTFPVVVGRSGVVVVEPSGRVVVRSEKSSKHKAMATETALPELSTGSCVAKRMHLDTIQVGKHHFSNEIQSGWPLTREMMSSVHVKGDTSKMRRLLHKLENGERIHAATFGGSFTHGAGCNDVDGNMMWECAWSARTERWLHNAFPNATVTWTNLAKAGATTSATYLGGIASILQPFHDSNESLLDLIFIDTLVNDANEATSWGATKDVKLPEEYMRDVPYEAFIRALKTLAPHAQVVAVEAGCPECLTASLSRKKILHHHGIPVIDYAGLVSRSNKLNSSSGPDRLWPQMNTVGITHEGAHPWVGFAPDIEAKGEFCCFARHPPWVVHQYVADCVSTALLEMLENACNTDSGAMLEDTPKPVVSYFPPRLEVMFPTCLALKSYHNARVAAGLPEASSLLQQEIAPSSGLPKVLSGDWRLYADVPGKPGWIATQPGSTIIFPVKLGRYPTVVMNVLKSYKGMGHALMTVYPAATQNQHSAERQYRRVDGAWTDHSSQFMPEFLSYADSAEHGSQIMLYDPKLDDDNYLLEVRIPPNQAPGLKFKIVLVSSC